MNAKNFSKVGVGLTLTALALSGALAVSASCAGGGGESTGGSGGGGSGGSGGGSGGGGSGGSGGGESSGGSGGGGGESTGGNGGGSCSPGANETCFANGKAEGVIQGYGYIALGKLDIADSPKCDNTGNGGAADEPITKETPCPEENATTVWSSTDALCISGTIPKVDTSSTTAWQDNWGMQIGMNVSAPPGETLGKKYKSITMTWDDDKIDPANTGIRAIVHRKDDDIELSYCAALTNGTAASFIAFNTQCWDGKGESLTEDDVANIDKVGIQISSDDKKEYKVNDFCLRKISFEE